MGQLTRDDNFVPGILVKGSATSADVIVEGDEATKGMNVQIVGDDVGIGGGIQFAIGTAAGATDKGTVSLAIRDDSLSTLSDAEGDWVGLRVGSTGALHVTGGGGGTEYTEDVVTADPQVGTATLIERDDQLSTVTPAQGDWIGLRGSSEGALWVAMADASGDPITSFGGGVQYTEGDVDTTITGTAAMWEDSGNTLRAVSSAKPLPISVASLPLPSGAATSAKQLADGHNVTVDNGAAGSAVNIQDGGNSITVDNTGLTDLASAISTINAAAPSVAMLVGGYDGNDIQAIRTTNNGNIILGAGTDAIGKLAANNGVDIGDVDVTSVIPGVGATNLGKQEDEAHTSGDVGVMALGVRKDDPVTQAADGEYTPILTSDMGALWTEHVPNQLEPGNSSTSTLNSGIAFTGTGKDVLKYDIVTITLDASHDSATDGMTFQFSTDDTNWDDVYTFTYTAADGARRFQFPVTAQFFRVVYTNGGTNQTHFRLQTIVHHNNSLTSIHRLVDDVSNDRSAQIVKAAIIAQKGGGGPGAGDFVAVQATAAGNLKMSIQEISDGLDIGAGNAGSETQRVILASDQNFVHIEDVAHSTGDAGVMMLGVENEDQADLSTGDKDYTPIGVTKEGNVIVKQEGVVAISGTVTANAGTNLNTSALLTTSAHDAAFGTAGSADAQVRTIQGVASMTPLVVTESSPITGFATSAKQLADGHNVTVDNASIAVTNAIGDGWDNAASDGASVSGDVAHDGIDAGEPVKVGMKAVASKADPTEVAANDRTDWLASVAGVPWVIGGHPNVLNASINVTDADGAQTNAAIITVAANLSIVVTHATVTAANSNTVDVQFRMGFGTTTTPAEDAAKQVLNHPGIAPGGGMVVGSGAGIIGQGLSNEDLRITCADPVDGSITVNVGYYVIAI